MTFLGAPWALCARRCPRCDKTMRRVAVGVTAAGWVVVAVCPDGVHCQYTEPVEPFEVTEDLRGLASVWRPEGGRWRP